MDTAVYKLYLAKPSLEAMLFPQEKFNEYMQKHGQIAKDLGMRTLLNGSIWSTDRYTMFGVERFPNWQAVREHTRRLNELNWFQYLQGETFLGVEGEDHPITLEQLNLETKVDWLAQIFVIGFHPAAYDATEAEQAQGMAVYEESKKLGVLPVFTVESRFSDEKYQSWGVEMYPSLEALVQNTRAQEKARWWKYYNTRSFLGTIEHGELVGK